MLQSEQGSRHKDGNLLAAKHRLVGSAQGNLGFSVANVTAKQAIHGHSLHHVALDFVCGSQLAVGLLKGKGIFKCLLVVVIRGEGVTRSAHALGIQTNEVLCNILSRGRGTRLCLLPALATHLGELYKSVIGMRANVFVYLVKLFNGYEQFVRSRILNADIIARNAFTC